MNIFSLFMIAKTPGTNENPIITVIKTKRAYLMNEIKCGFVTQSLPLIIG